jgi:hypothetical protein
MARLLLMTDAVISDLPKKEKRRPVVKVVRIPKEHVGA